MTELSGSGHHAVARNLSEPGARDVIAGAVVKARDLHFLVNSADVTLLDAALGLSEHRWNATLAVDLERASRCLRRQGL